MFKTLSAGVTNCDGLISIVTQDSHVGGSAQAVVECVSTDLTIGDSVEIELGYDGDNDNVFMGYVKMIEQVVPNNTYIVTCNDVLTRAIDYFIASSDPDQPFERSNIAAESLVEDLMELAGLTDFTADATDFTFGVVSPVEVNLVSVFDFSKMIADLLAFHIWADDSGTVHFEDRKPYVMDDDSPVATLTTKLRVAYRESEKDLRNRVVVYGSNGIFAEAEDESPYLPDGFFKTVVLATQIIQSTQVAQDAADFNLELLNRLTRQASVSIEGDPNIHARDVVTLSDTFTGISGDWYVFALEHKWGREGYTTNMELRK